jgi:hypothetical protein
MRFFLVTERQNCKRGKRPQALRKLALGQLQELTEKGVTRYP